MVPKSVRRWFNRHGERLTWLWENRSRLSVAEQKELAKLELECDSYLDQVQLTQEQRERYIRELVNS